MQRSFENPFVFCIIAYLDSPMLHFTALQQTTVQQSKQNHLNTLLSFKPALSLRYFKRKIGCKPGPSLVFLPILSDTPDRYAFDTRVWSRVRFNAIRWCSWTQYSRSMLVWAACRVLEAAKIKQVKNKRSTPSTIS